jgi:predicted LPLAT superfamily acyltransferase
VPDRNLGSGHFVAQESSKHLLQLTVSFEAHADKIVTVNREALAQALQAVIQEFNKQVQTTAGLPMIEQRASQR